MNTQRTAGNPQVLSAALSEAESIIGEAEKRAAELRSTAEAVREEARRAGYEAGVKEGRTEATDKAVRLIIESSALREQLADEAGRLAIEICRMLFREGVAIEPAHVQRLAVQALQQATLGESAMILTNPNDVEPVEAAVRGLRQLGPAVSVSVVPDPQLSRGGVIVRTDFGEIDASIETLLESVASQLGVLKERR